MAVDRVQYGNSDTGYSVYSRRLVPAAPRKPSSASREDQNLWRFRVFRPSSPWISQTVIGRNARYPLRLPTYPLECNVYLNVDLVGYHELDGLATVAALGHDPNVLCCMWLCLDDEKPTAARRRV